MSRLWNRLLALWGGYFWLPCPICGRNFGGHEWAATLKHSAFRGEGVCPKCVMECSRRNAANAELFEKQEDQWWAAMKFEMSKCSCRETSS